MEDKKESYMEDKKINYIIDPARGGMTSWINNCIEYCDVYDSIIVVHPCMVNDKDCGGCAHWFPKDPNGGVVI
ncbi:MAG TPA: hypothetical protein ENG48_12305 [Candidatus Atribacteria bacterium]|nr:hypothetical protein [Candidatus Atribacteria bacterium]